MLKIYTSYNCSSCKKATKWLTEHGIEYEDYNFFSKELTPEEIKHMLMYTTNGFEEIISERSKVYQMNKETLPRLNVTQLIEFIVVNPSILKRPIIVDDVTENILVGYNKSDMEMFL